MEFPDVEVVNPTGISSEMSTSGRGRILPAERSSIIGGFTTVEDEAGIKGSNAFEIDGDGGDPANRAGA